MSCRPRTTNVNHPSTSSSLAGAKGRRIEWAETSILIVLHGRPIEQEKILPASKTNIWNFFYYFSSYIEFYFLSIRRRCVFHRSSSSLFLLSSLAFTMNVTPPNWTIRSSLSLNCNCLFFDLNLFLEKATSLARTRSSIMIFSSSSYFAYLLPISLSHLVDFLLINSLETKKIVN